MDASGANAGRTGGQLLVEALVANGLDTVFCVPGESYLEVLDALHDVQDRVRLIVCRQEGGATYAAEAFAKMTGRPGVAMVTRGPGATNGSVGIHTAMQDSTPMVLIIGDVARDQRDREAFQEVDFVAMYRPLAKWAATIREADRVPEYMARAIRTAMSGRPGPVVLSVPEDMLREIVPDAASRPPVPAVARPAQAPDPAAMEALRERLAKAERPFLMVGGGTWTAQAVRDIRLFAEANGLPVGTSFRAQDHFDNTHPLFAGHVGIGIAPALRRAIEGSDLLIVAGPRLGEITTSGYAFPTVPVPQMPLVHVHPDPGELGRVYQPTIAIAADMAGFAAAARTMEPADGQRWAGWAEEINAGYRAFSTVPEGRGPVDLGAVMAHLGQVCPPDTILTNGAGNYASWVNRFWRFRSFRSLLGPTSGSMGYGVPAAIAAKLAAPERMVLSFNGDGCFLMNGQELATAAQYGLDPIFLVVDNGMYGTIRMHQERRHPGRVSGTGLVNPDFAALARAYGAHGEWVERTEDFPAAFARAREAGRAALIALRIDPEALTPTETLSEMRQKALAAKR